MAYATPWKEEDDEEEEDASDESWEMDEKKVALVKYWRIIQNEYNKIGRVVFQSIIEELQEPFYSDCLVYYFPVGSSDTDVTPPPFEESPKSEESPTNSCSTTTSATSSQLLGRIIMI